MKWRVDRLRAPFSFSASIGRAAWQPRWIDAALILCGAALILRWGLIGDPLAGYDEQFYLLVGQRWLDGALPYVDIWDRKPPGLFALYAAAAALGSGGVLAYQLLATGVAAATALIIAAIVARHEARSVGIACGLLYLLYLTPLRGDVGQAPVFYNALIAAAALAVFAAWPRLETQRGHALAVAAMLACGAALTIKTTVIFESAAFGIALLIGSRRAGLGWPAIARRAGLFMAIGATPFLLFAAWFAAHGALDAFWFANARSAMLRRHDWAWADAIQLGFLLASLAPLALLGMLGWRHRSVSQRAEQELMLGWLAAAAIGVVSVGIYHEHYALPMLVPLAIVAAPFIARGPLRLSLLALIAAAPLYAALVEAPRQGARDRADWQAIAAAIPARVRHECMFVFAGPPILYQATDACLVSRFAFPDHLASAGEAGALGIDPSAELDRVLAARPAVIVTDDDPYALMRSAAATARVDAVLARHYRLRARIRTRFFEHDRTLLIWVHNG